MKKTHLIILGAGKPHYGKEPAALKKIYENIYTLNFILDYSKKLNLKITYVSGYKNKKIKKNFPKLNVIYNKDWSTTGPIYSLKNIKFSKDEDVVILYSDVLIRFETLKKLVFSNSDLTCLIDTKYKDRYKFRETKDFLSKEKVIFRTRKNFFFSNNIYSNNSAELVGVIKISKKEINELEKLINIINKHKNKYKLFVLLEKLRKKKNIKLIDLEGDWAEVNKIDDISKFILGTKSETLKRLKDILKKGEILDQVKFTVLEWKKDKKSILQKINKKFKKKTLIVRSSAIDEDGIHLSNAGKYLSVLDVKGTKKINNSVNKVIKSFQKNINNNEIFIQEHLKNSKYVGVLTTKSKRSGSPWYVINYQKSSDTELITKGDSNEVKTLFYRRDLNPNKLKKAAFKKLLLATKELETILSNDNLDIEFAITKNDKVFIFQVRPLYVKPENKSAENIIIKNYKFYEKKYKKYKLNSKLSNSNDLIFGVMPDWNPAEIIGFKPDYLSLSIYQKLITKNNWAKQRYEFGYRKIKNSVLIESFCGTPYVCVNKSIESFIPKDLPKNISKKILQISLKKLKKNPNKHDKIEFEIIPNCLDFDFYKWNKFYKNNQLTDEQVNRFKNDLIRINKNALNIYSKNSNKLEYFLNFKIDEKYSNQKKIKLLLKTCVDNLTLMFAHFARCGFISVIIMKSALKNKIISKKNYNVFFNSINTISKDFQKDIFQYKQKRITKNKLIKKYGHLRPGTYDITSQRYDENQNLFLKDTVTKPKINKIQLQREKIFNNQFLKELSTIGFNKNKDEIIDFFYGSIEKRESSKFLFTRYLSDFLKLISKELNKKGISDKEISMLNLNNVTDLIYKKVNINFIKKIIKTNLENYKINLASDMPNLIFSVEDFKKFELLSDEPNFVGENIVHTNFIQISKFENSIILDNKIILIDSADPGYDWIFGHKIKGLITKYGGVNSHMAIRCAELNLTAAIGVGEKTFQNILNSNKVIIDPKNKILKSI